MKCMRQRGINLIFGLRNYEDRAMINLDGKTMCSIGLSEQIRVSILDILVEMPHGQLDRQNWNSGGKSGIFNI